MSAGKEKTERVVGLQYEPGEGLPQVVLKGSGKLAEDILERGRQDRKTVVRDEKLLKQLYRLPVDAEIGPDLFQLVAILLAHVFAIEGKRRREANG